MTQQKSRFSFRNVLLILLMAAVIFGVPNSVFADDEYYATWDEWQAAGMPSDTWNDVVDAMESIGETAKELYAAGDADGAYDCINDDYYGYYETTGFERIAMGYISGSRKTEMELQFSACKSVAKNGGSTDEFNEEVDLLVSMLREDANVLDGVSDDSSSDDSSSDTASDDSSDTSSDSTTKSAWAATFTACLGILVREGFEAILIVGAIIAYLVKSKGDDIQQRKKVCRPVYFGSILGIICSFVLAWLLNLLKLANSASQEVIEGVTALIAVCVLYYVSNWMLSKSESDRWTSYIKGKAEKSQGSVMALAFTAFLAVFREGAEVVLFYQPLMSDDNLNAVWGGFLVGCVIIVFVYLAIRFLSIKIPIRPFFTATSIFMFAMSISFLGAGIKELIEGDVFTMIAPDWLSWIPSNNILDVLGIYGTLQTLIPQIALLVVTIIIFVVQTKKNNKIHRAAEAERAKQRAIEEAERAKAEEEAFRLKIRAIVEEVLDERAGIIRNPDPEAIEDKAAALIGDNEAAEGEASEGDESEGDEAAGVSGAASPAGDAEASEGDESEGDEAAGVSGAASLTGDAEASEGDEVTEELEAAEEAVNEPDVSNEAKSGESDPDK